jgi:hypothetical protein
MFVRRIVALGGLVYLALFVAVSSLDAQQIDADVAKALVGKWLWSERHGRKPDDTGRRRNFRFHQHNADL